MGAPGRRAVGRRWRVSAGPFHRCGDPVIDRAADDAIKAVATSARVALCVGHNYVDQGITFVLVTLRRDAKAARVDCTGSPHDMIAGLRAVLRDLEARVARVNETACSEDELAQALSHGPDQGGAA